MRASAMKLVHALRHHDLGPFARAGGRGKAFALLARASMRAASELALARLRFARFSMAMVARGNANAARGREADAASEADRVTLEQLAFVIPRVAARLPWRSDCLPQAMAAQRWLADEGIASTLTIGIDRRDGLPFSAHAWLRHGEKVVTGGAVADYAAIFGDAAAN